MRQAQSPQRDTTPIRKTARMGRGALAMWKSLVPRPTLAAGTSAMRGSEGRRLAPSATPWDDAGERSPGPAETLVMACHRDLHGYRHAGASPGERRTSSTHASGTRARDVGPARPGATEGPERHQAPAVPVPRTPPRRGHRGHVRIPPHACGRSGGVPARDVLARGPGRAPPGQAGGRGRLPPAGPPGRSPCWPGHGAASRRPATRGPTRGAVRPRAGTGGARRTGRGHAGRRGARPASPSAATGGAGRTPRASARGSQASPGRGRRMRAISRGAPTRHATWRGATRRSSGSPGRRRGPTTRGGRGRSRTRRTHHAGPASHAACRGCSRARIPDSTGRGRGVSRPVPRDDEPSRREDGEGRLRARPRNALPTCVEMPRALPKEDQLKGNSVLLGTHNQQRRIYLRNAPQCAS